VAGGQDEGARRENFGLPAVREAEVHSGRGGWSVHGLAL
jgi:hypothetical protein